MTTKTGMIESTIRLELKDEAALKILAEYHTLTKAGVIRRLIRRELTKYHAAQRRKSK